MLVDPGYEVSSYGTEPSRAVTAVQVSRAGYPRSTYPAESVT